MNTPGNETLDKLRKTFNWLIKGRDYYTPLTPEQYLLRFKITNQEIAENNKELVGHAYNRAWQNRDFEIDKFWARAAYFWGFIVLIFGGYIAVITRQPSNASANFPSHLDLYLLLLGLLFSISWFLVIRGSKAWQQNWEKHIDFLEDYVSGPLYKTVFYSGWGMYSVSKLNEVMALAVILVWAALLTQHLAVNYEPYSGGKIDLVASLALLVAALFATVLLFGYCLTNIQSLKNNFIDRWEK